MSKNKIFEAIAKAEKFAKDNGVFLEICKRSFIDDDCLDVNEYADDTELMSMQYKGYLVNVYIGSWDSFKEAGKWIDYDIFYNDYELMNDGDDVCETNDVLEAATDVKFYMNKIENIIKREEV
jgi:hypothetical protein